MEEFIYKNKKSSSFYMSIVRNQKYTGARNNFDEIQIPNRAGTLTVNNGKLADIEKSISFNVRIPSEELKHGNTSMFEIALEISEWLKPDEGYAEWKWSDYPEYIWLAKIRDPYSLADTVSHFGKGVIKVRFYPIMYYSQDYGYLKRLSDEQIIHNYGTVEAEPLIYIEPNGYQKDLVLYNNNEKWLHLKNVSSTVIIDSREKVILNARTNKTIWQNVERLPELFPKLKIGTNRITFNENQTNKITIDKRIGRLAI